jgi:FSR family fosmidomycin resistance protein-like MFS transporter
LTLALAYQLESQNATASAIGAVQSAFMAGIGVGGIVCAAVVSPRWERQILWLMPVAAAPFVAGLAFLQGPSLTLAVGLAGGLHGVGMPVFISSGQLLVPAGQRVASTMGVSWGVAGGLAAVSLRCYQQANNVAGIFPFLAIISVLSGILCLCLPRPEPTDTR